MDISESASESTYSSCKRQENGDATTETDRPLKKARFAWQVKGKYHLKNDISDNKTSTNSLDPCNAGSSLEKTRETKEILNTNTNLEQLGVLLEKDMCTLDSKTKSDQQMLPSIGLSQENLPYPRYISSSITRESCDVNNETRYDVNLRNFLEDQCITSWQARQMTKCFLDNTINSLIDNWMKGPLLTDIDDDRFTIFGAPEPLDNINNDDSIENEGILMAISAHGLQSTSNSSDYGANTTNVNCSKGVVSSLSLDGDYSDDILDSNVSFKGSQHSFSKQLGMSFSYTDEIKSNSNQPRPNSDESSNFSYTSYDPTDNSTCQVEYDTDTNNYSDNDTNSHYDFLDTAVSFAIQYKGLTSYGTDYG